MNRVRIGEWLAHPALNELRRGSETVRIEPKVMDVLMVLAKRAGTVVSREEFLATVWPGMVVGDEALSQSVAKLRRALGDDPRAPTYIETIAKRGYRLNAAVADGATDERAGKRRPARWAIPAAGVLLVVGAVAFLWAPRGGVPVVPEQAEERGATWVAVTVLPFETMGAEPYLARGISDTLATELGRAASLRIIAASDPKEAARRARYVVSGSVQQDGGTIRVNARLVDTRTNEQLWSERFERPFGDLFSMQDEIIRKLTEALPARVTQAERLRVAKPYTRSLEAYDHFLRAQALFLVRGARENEEARALYRRAVEIDPGFARAYAGLAMTHALEPRVGGAADPERSLDRALALARSAQLIDPEIAEVHWALGFVHAQARRYDQAIDSLKRAIELNPSFADAYALLGGIHTYVGEPARTIPLLRTAMRLNPDGGYLYFLILGRAYLFENDVEQALINLREASARNPADIETRIYLAAALATSGDRAAAAWELEEIRSLDRGFSLPRWLESYPLARAADKRKLEEGVRPLNPP